MLLKEITLRYSPVGNDPYQIIRDFLALEPVWRQVNLSPENESRTDVINSTFQQVVEAMAIQAMEWTQNKKLKARLAHAVKMEDWSEASGAINEILVNIFGREVKRYRKGKVSPAIEKIIHRSTIEPTPPTSEPTTSVGVKPWNGLGQNPSVATNPPVAAPYQFPYSNPNPPPETISIPPEKPKEKFPVPDLTGIQPLGAPMAGNEPKRLGANLEKAFTDYDYNWSEEEKGYKNDKRNILVQILPNNSVKATLLSNGKTGTYPNIGDVLRKIIHGKKRRHPVAVPTNQPEAGVTNENYRMLYEFLYS